MDGISFAIRDDDVNYFTNPEEVEAAYGSIWDMCPPTLSAITHIKGNWRYWIKEVYNTGQSIDWNLWDLDDKVYPIHENRSLIQFIREKYNSGKIDLSLHAIHHRNGDPVLPKVRLNNYIQGAEFYTSLDLTQKVKSALSYLKSELGINVRVFTPPQNLMTTNGYQSVTKNGLSIVGAGIPFWQKEKSVNGLQSMYRVLVFKLMNQGIDFPYVLRYAKHSELIHHYPLHPSTKIDELIEKFDLIYRFNGVFVLSTHYHEFETKLTYDKTRMMSNIFSDFMNYVGSKKNVRYSSLSSLL